MKFFSSDVAVTPEDLGSPGRVPLLTAKSTARRREPESEIGYTSGI
jgi:3,4-dihydroxy-2-butanone 4-phosphate synthase